MNHRRLRAWKSGLLATSALAAALFAASLLWQQGHPQWAFLLAFTGAWALVSLILAIVDYTEQSGLVLAHILDDHVDDLLARIGELEREIEQLRRERSDGFRKAS